MKTSSRSAGFLVHEAIMALALAMAVVVGAAELLSVVAHERRAAGQYALAVAEAGNLMEDIVSRPWADTTAERLESIELSDACRRCLPDARVAVDVAEEERGARRISIRIDWLRFHEEGRRGGPVRLVGWKFPDEEAAP
jgi:hypothetical protein